MIRRLIFGCSKHLARGKVLFDSGLLQKSRVLYLENQINLVFFLVDLMVEV